jgi:hypothetical protein
MASVLVTNRTASAIRKVDFVGRGGIYEQRENDGKLYYWEMHAMYKSVGV